MSDLETLRENFREDSPASRRQKRAARTRAKALSPRRIIGLVASLPIVACSVAFSIYLRTSPFEPAQAVQHLLAMRGCDVTRKIGLAPAKRGQPGYHTRHDPDGDGVACEPVRMSGVRQRTDPAATQAESSRQMQGGAKFVKP